MHDSRSVYILNFPSSVSLGLCNWDVFLLVMCWFFLKIAKLSGSESQPREHMREKPENWKGFFTSPSIFRSFTRWPFHATTRSAHFLARQISRNLTSQVVWIFRDFPRSWPPIESTSWREKSNHKFMCLYTFARACDVNDLTWHWTN